LRDSWAVQRLQWFTKGFYATQSIDKKVVITDLRMGFEPEYAFRFKVGETGNPHPHPAPVEQLPGIRSFERLHWVWARIWDPQAR
jgi:inner membrane protein